MDNSVDQEKSPEEQVGLELISYVDNAFKTLSKVNDTWKEENKIRQTDKQYSCPNFIEVLSQLDKDANDFNATKIKPNNISPKVVREATLFFSYTNNFSKYTKNFIRLSTRNKDDVVSVVWKYFLCLILRDSEKSVKYLELTLRQRQKINELMAEEVKSAIDAVKDYYKK